MIAQKFGDYSQRIKKKKEKLGQFICTQAVRRLVVPDWQGRFRSLSIFKGVGISKIDQRVAEDSDTIEFWNSGQLGVAEAFETAEESKLDELWPALPNRFGFLSDLSQKRICVSVGAGIGKSTLVEQLELVTQLEHPDHLVIRLEISELPNEKKYFVDQPPVGKSLPILAEHFRDTLDDLAEDARQNGNRPFWCRRQIRQTPTCDPVLRGVT